MQPATSRQRFYKAAAILTAAYLSAVFFGLPLVFGNYYFNITETKQAFFLLSSGFYLLFLLFARIVFPPDYGPAVVAFRRYADDEEDAAGAAARVTGSPVITSYSIHYTKLYDEGVEKGQLHGSSVCIVRYGNCLKKSIEGSSMRR